MFQYPRSRNQHDLLQDRFVTARFSEGYLVRDLVYDIHWPLHYIFCLERQNGVGKKFPKLTPIIEFLFLDGFSWNNALRNVFVKKASSQRKQTKRIHSLWTSGEFHENFKKLRSAGNYKIASIHSLLPQKLYD